MGLFKEHLSPISSLGSGISFTVEKPLLQEVTKKVKKLDNSFHCNIDPRQNFTHVILIQYLW